VIVIEARLYMNMGDNHIIPFDNTVVEGRGETRDEAAKDALRALRAYANFCNLQECSKPLEVRFTESKE
jgi:hypothetical protein